MDRRRDVQQLAAELLELNPTLPAALAPWNAPAWRAGTFAPSAGLRTGELHLPEAPDLRIPMVLSVPLRRPLWLSDSDSDSDSGAGAADGPVSLMAMAGALIIRLLAADSAVRLHLCDVDGSLVGVLGDLIAPARGLLCGPVARSSETVRQTLRVLVEPVDLLEMARDAGELGSLPMADTKPLLVITDVPAGFGEVDHRRLRYLVERAPVAGLQIILLGDPEAAGPATEIAHVSLRLGPTLGDSLSDGWVGMVWSFTPDFGPIDPASIVFRS